MTDTRPETTAPDYTTLFAQALDESTQGAPVLRPVPAQVSPARLPAGFVHVSDTSAPAALPVGHEVIAELRFQASGKIGEAAGADASMTEQDRRQRGQSIIMQVVSEWATKYAAASGADLTPEQERAVRGAVFDELFRARPSPAAPGRPQRRKHPHLRGQGPRRLRRPPHPRMGPDREDGPGPDQPHQPPRAYAGSG